MLLISCILIEIQELYNPVTDSCNRNVISQTLLKYNFNVASTDDHYLTVTMILIITNKYILQLTAPCLTFAL